MTRNPSVRTRRKGAARGRQSEQEAELTVEQAGSLLRELGLRRTLVRTCVLQLLSKQRTAMSQADVSSALASYGFDESTIFRSLSDLVDRRIITRVDTGDKTWRFWFRLPGENGSFSGGKSFTSHRIVHVCLDCSRVTPVRADHLQYDREGAEVRARNIDEIVLRGRCDDCLEAASTDAPQADSSATKKSRGEVASTASNRGPGNAE
ncbi:MAG: Fur family transcriptional regulator [Planctomycetaceae bacterium]